MFRSFRRITTVASTMKLDSAVAKLLGIDPANASVSPVGGGMSSASASKITAKLEDGSEKLYFMKTGKGKEAEVMFEGVSAVHVFLSRYYHMKEDRKRPVHIVGRADEYSRGVFTQANMHLSMPCTPPCRPSVPNPSATAHYPTAPRSTSS